MDVATLIILIVVGGVILWGALTDWTFSGIFDGRGGAKRDSPPGPISDVQLEVATGESGGRRESYTSLDEMKGLSITVSFNTPKSSFGYGDLALKDYVISLGTASGSNTRNNLLAVIFISRTKSTKLFTGAVTNGVILDSTKITLSGDFNATDTRVSITLSDTVWTDGNIILPAGDVFLGIDYTPSKLANTQYTWVDGTAAEPAGKQDTRYFIPGGVTLSGTIQDNGVFVVNPDVIETINEELNIAMGSGDISGELDIRKQIGNESRFLISPLSRPGIFFGFLGGGANIKGSILGSPREDCELKTFREMPNDTTDVISNHVNLGSIPADEFWGEESNWFNFAVIERREDGWVRLGLISNFVTDDESANQISIKRAAVPVIHPVHHWGPNHTYLSYHQYNTSTHNVTYFKFVAPLDSSSPQGGKKFSLCVRSGFRDDIDNILSKDLSTEDLFLVLKDDTTTGVRAELEKLQDIVSLWRAVFTKRNPDSEPDVLTDNEYIYFRTGNTIHEAISIHAPKSNFNQISVPGDVDNVVVPSGYVLDLWRYGYTEDWDPCSYTTGYILTGEGRITHWNFKPINNVSSDQICTGGNYGPSTPPSVAGYTFSAYMERVGGERGTGAKVTLAECKTRCDTMDGCAGFSYNPDADPSCLTKGGGVMSIQLTSNNFTFYEKDGGARTENDCKTTGDQDTCKENKYYKDSCYWKQGSSPNGCLLRPSGNSGSPTVSPLDGYTFELRKNWERGTFLMPNDGITHTFVRHEPLSECAEFCNSESKCIGFSHGIHTILDKDYCIIREKNSGRLVDTSGSGYSIKYTYYAKPCSDIDNVNVCRNTSHCNWWTGYGSNRCVPK